GTFTSTQNVEKLTPSKVFLPDDETIPSVPYLLNIPKPPAQNLPTPKFDPSKAEMLSKDPTYSNTVQTTGNKPTQPAASKDGYRLGAGDSIYIKIWSGDHLESEMSGEYMLLNNGAIELPIVGRLLIGGLNEKAATEYLSQALNNYIINPIVHINIQGYNSQKAHVLGAVNSPGPIVIDQPMTILTALSKASLNRTKRHDGAWAAQKVYLQRKNDDVLVFDLEALLQRGEGNVFLEHGDIIYVADGAYVYVNGKVEKPGGVPFRDGMTITDALSHAGGHTNTANLKEVYILRNGKRIRINVKKIFQAKAPDVSLKEGDRLFVEESMW
ncbi:MAG: SLBB domain-containing protein, partial [Myxococcota bacterium]|nr:SLBB domain-containing protein [Myxococcota bacterium]